MKAVILKEIGYQFCKSEIAKISTSDKPSSRSILKNCETSFFPDLMTRALRAWCTNQGKENGDRTIYKGIRKQHFYGTRNGTQ